MSRRLDDTGKLLLRVAIGGLLFMHGLAKIRDNSFVQGAVLDAGLPGWVAYGVFLGEIVAPVLLIIGLLTRTAALLVAIDMIFALTLVHGAQLTQLTPSGGWAVELPVLFLATALTIAMIGPGTLAVAWNPRRDLLHPWFEDKPPELQPVRVIHRP